MSFSKVVIRVSRSLVESGWKNSLIILVGQRRQGGHEALSRRGACNVLIPSVIALILSCYQRLPNEALYQLEIDPRVIPMRSAILPEDIFFWPYIPRHSATVIPLSSNLRANACDT